MPKKQLKVNLDLFMDIENKTPQGEAADKLFSILYDALQQYNNITIGEFLEIDVVDEEEE